MARIWTDEQIEEIKTLRRQGLTPKAIAARLGRTPSVIAGILFRAGMTKAKRARKPKPRQESPSGRVWRTTNYDHLAPAQYPFASDCSEPNFAWDDVHCAAVLARGGFPALQFRRAA